MTPKEQAKSITEVYFKNPNISWNQAKISAIADVEKIISRSIEVPIHGQEMIQYWSEVKVEIEKL
jgi:hypothetical protein